MKNIETQKYTTQKRADGVSHVEAYLASMRPSSSPSTTKKKKKKKKKSPGFYSFIHICIYCLGHSPSPPRRSPPSPSPHPGIQILTLSFTMLTLSKVLNLSVSWCLHL
jgi:hypothetical protein